MKIPLLLAALSSCSVTLSIAKDSFTRYDSNDDGTVTYAELARGKKMDFHKMDRNRDKVITAAEFAVPGKEEWKEHDLFATPEFKTIDGNFDRMLSLSEFEKSVARMINLCDTNADHAVSREEYEAVVLEEKKRSAAILPGSMANDQLSGN